MDRVLADTYATIKDAHDRLHAALVADGCQRYGAWNWCQCAKCRACDELVDLVNRLSIAIDSSPTWDDETRWEPVAVGYEHDLGGEG